MAEEDRVDQTSNDAVTGVDVVEGVLTLRRFDGSTETYSFVDSLPTEDPAVAGALWNDADVVMISEPSDVFLASLPTADPAVAGALWNDEGVVMLSTGP